VYGPGEFVRSQLLAESGTSPPSALGEVGILLQPGGTAEFVRGDVCVILAFTAMRNGEAIYTDDGLGRGLTVLVGKDGRLTVTHVSGWQGRTK